MQKLIITDSQVTKEGHQQQWLQQSQAIPFQASHITPDLSSLEVNVSIYMNRARRTCLFGQHD